MNKKGFTLIELLAVIVILAIIALIATPIVLGIIEDARKSAKERSAEMVYTGVQYAYTTALYDTTEDTKLGVATLDTIKSNLNIKNMKSAVVENSVLTIKTDDGVICKVKAATGNGANNKDEKGFVVNCGESETKTDNYLKAELIGISTPATW